jgi:hypothetical protein
MYILFPDGIRDPFVHFWYWCMPDGSELTAEFNILLAQKFFLFWFLCADPERLSGICVCRDPSKNLVLCWNDGLRIPGLLESMPVSRRVQYGFRVSMY